MDKKLPNVFVNSKATTVNGNNKKVYYSFYNKKSINNYSGVDIRKKINSLFADSSYSYKVKALITYKTGEKTEETIVFKNYNYLLNIKGEKIFINDIIDIS